MHPTIAAKLRNGDNPFADNPSFPSRESILHGGLEVYQRLATKLEKLQPPLNGSDFQIALRALEAAIAIREIELRSSEILVPLAVEMVREEFGFAQHEVTIDAKLVDIKDMFGEVGRLHAEIPVGEESKNLTIADDELFKRRTINAMIQGSGHFCQDLFHLHLDEISRIDSRLPNLYREFMLLGDWAYWAHYLDQFVGLGQGPGGFTTPPAGIERIDRSTTPPTVHVRAISVPVLTHEIAKGLVELIARIHGFPDDPLEAASILAKVDRVENEPWDLRIGPALWLAFNCGLPDRQEDRPRFRNDSFKELVSLPATEFHARMRKLFKQYSAR